MEQIKVTHIGHSGFLLETQEVYMLFDYYRGEMPELSPEKHLYVFSSHRHHDHFYPKVLDYSGREGGVTFILSDDIREEVRLAKQVADKTRPEEIMWIGPHRSLEADGLGTVETLASTDEGVAFIVTGSFGSIYHAGDLHWWNWDGEDPEWLKWVEDTYKEEVASLKKRSFDLAFVVLDDRLEGNYAQGMAWFLEHCPVRYVFPMHYWEDKSVVDRFPKEQLGGAQLMPTNRQREWVLD